MKYLQLRMKSDTDKHNINIMLISVTFPRVECPP